jgi:hypothetical protein
MHRGNCYCMLKPRGYRFACCTCCAYTLYTTVFPSRPQHTTKEPNPVNAKAKLQYSSLKTALASSNATHPKNLLSKFSSFKRAQIQRHTAASSSAISLLSTSKFSRSWELRFVLESPPEVVNGPDSTLFPSASMRPRRTLNA